MKTLLLIATMMTLAACSNSLTSVSLSGSGDAAFQKKSIYNIGLTHTIALTFDDGPSSEHTPALLDILKNENVHATFFLNGVHVPHNEWILKRMYDEGHVVANHTQDHDNLTKLVKEKGMQAVFDQIMQTHELIKPFFQPSGRLYFRAPFGNWKNVSADYLNQDQILRAYIGPIFWDIGGEISRDQKTRKILFDSYGNPLSAADWDCWAPAPGQSKPKLTIDQCFGGYMNESTKLNGGIVIMHDHTAQTVEMAGRLIRAWKNQGYKFVTLDQIDALDKYTSANAIQDGVEQENRNNRE